MRMCTNLDPLAFGLAIHGEAIWKGYTRSFLGDVCVLMDLLNASFETCRLHCSSLRYETPIVLPGDRSLVDVSGL